MSGDEERPRTLRELYDEVAEGWDQRRARELFERAWLERFLAIVPEGAPVLDLGCGTGEPISGYLVAQGHPVTGVDFSEAMLAIAGSRFPDQEWILADMRGLELGRRFGGIVAWDSFFHLGREEQRAMFPVFARHLVPGGALMFTSGPREGEATGAVEGRAVPHASLSPAAYAACLEQVGLELRRFVAEDPDCTGHSVWLARAKGAETLANPQRNG